MTTPRTVTGKAQHAEAWSQIHTASAERCRACARLAAIEAQAAEQERERLIARAIAQHQRLHGYSGSIYRCTAAYCEGARDALDIGPEDIK